MVDQKIQAQQAESVQNNPENVPEPTTPESSGDVLDQFEPKDFSAIDTTNPESVLKQEENAPAETPPELLAGKYKTQEELVEGYLNLQKKIGNFVGAPEEYTLENVNKDTQNTFVSDDPYLDKFKKMAKDHNMSQDMFDKILNLYRDFVMDMMPKPQDEMAKLGNDADIKLRGLRMWIDTNLSPDGKNRFKKYMGDSVSEAELFLLLDEMRNAVSPVEGPTRMEAAQSAQRSIDEIKQEIADNWSKYESNPSYRSEKLRQLSEALNFQKKYKNG